MMTSSQTAHDIPPDIAARFESLGSAQDYVEEIHEVFIQAPLLDALDNWVETDKAPEVLVGTKANGSVTRPHCAWPNVAQYRGSGEPNDTASWQCVPRRSS